jgi:hypothetical protein
VELVTLVLASNSIYGGRGSVGWLIGEVDGGPRQDGTPSQYRISAY